METLKEIILKAFKEGKTIQSRDGSGWKDFIPQNQLDTPNLDYGGIDYWRIKPESTMKTLHRKVAFEIQQQDYNKTVLIGKSANFIFNPNTRNGEELTDFLSGCEEIPDNSPPNRKTGSR